MQRQTLSIIIFLLQRLINEYMASQTFFSAFSYAFLCLYAPTKCSHYRKIWHNLYNRIALHLVFLHRLKVFRIFMFDEDHRVFDHDPSNSVWFSRVYAISYSWHLRPFFSELLPLLILSIINYTKLLMGTDQRETLLAAILILPMILSQDTPLLDFLYSGIDILNFLLISQLLLKVRSVKKS